MKSIKQKYSNMTKDDLSKSLLTVRKSILKAKMSTKDDSKAYADLRKLKYELALVRTLLSLQSTK